MSPIFHRSTPVIWPEARPLLLDGGPVGVVVSHGFTGSVQSIAPLAHGLAEAGHTVSAPRLPGHGTTWRDLERTRWWDWYGAVEDAYLMLRERCAQVFIAGLSMGGALALRLAAHHDVSGVILINPAIASRDRRIPVAARLHRILPAQPGIASDIADPAGRERGYERFSVTSLKTMTDLWKEAQSGLARIDAPTLLMRSLNDHVVDDLTAKILRARLPRLQEIALERSYHVATLDHDRELIVEEAAAFIQSNSGALDT